MKPLPKVVHISVHDGDVKEAQDSADDETEDDDNAQGLVGIQPPRWEECQRNHCRHRRAGSHQDGTQPFGAGSLDGFIARHPLLPVAHDEVNEQDCRRDVHPAQDDDCHDGDRGKVHLHQPQAEEYAT